MNIAQFVIPLQLFLPVIFAFGLLLPIPALSRRRVAWSYSAVTSALSFGMSLFVASQFDWSNPVMQLQASFVWMPSLGLEFGYGVDGISIWLVMLTTFLMPIVVLGSLIEVDHDMRTFHFWLHILEAALIGTFIATDVLMFYACFEFTLIPLFFLIGLFGHEKKLKAAMTFFYYTFTGSVLTLAGVIYVAYRYAEIHDGRWSFQIAELYTMANHLSFTEQCWVMLAMLAGFAIKTPMFPFHTWLPLAHTEAPTAGSVDLAGLVLKLGPYGLLRLAIPMAPAAAIAFAPYLGAFACVGIVYAALVCWVQRDAKKLIAYSSVSHMGFCMIGLFAFDEGNIGAAGAIFYMLAHGLATGGLFLCVGMLYDRFETRDLRKLGGLATEMPLFSFFFVLFVLASVGLPGLNGFVGEFLTMIGTFNSPDGVLGPVFAIVAASGVILSAIYLLFLTGKLIWGKEKHPGYSRKYDIIHEHGVDPTHVHGLSRREIATLTPLAVMCVVLGVFPGIVLNSLEGKNGPVEQMLAQAKTYIDYDANAVAWEQGELFDDDGLSASDADQEPVELVQQKVRRLVESDQREETLDLLITEATRGNVEYRVESSLVTTGRRQVGSGEDEPDLAERNRLLDSFVSETPAFLSLERVNFPKTGAE